LKAKVFLLLAVALCAALLGSSSAAATPASNFSATILSKGTVAKPAEIEALGIHYANEGPVDVIVQRGDFVGQSNTGWHQHPGLIVVTVKSGTLLVHNGCRTTSYGPGQSVIEPPLKPIMVEALADAQVVTVLIVPTGRAPRIDVTPAPVCPAISDQQSD
jgi:quercetin dioxygenase-like cupin family protein